MLSSYILSQRLMGERVGAAVNQLRYEKALQKQRMDKMNEQKQRDLMVAIIRRCFERCAPFLEGTLVAAFDVSPDEVEEIMINATNKVLSPPIVDREWEWFKTHVLPSSVWLMQNSSERYLFEDLLKSANDKAVGITKDMKSIYEDLKKHGRWNELYSIVNRTHFDRQNHEEVGLLSEDDGFECKEDNELEAFIGGDAAISELIATAQALNNEFQNTMRAVLSPYGAFEAGPIKKTGTLHREIGE